MSKVTLVERDGDFVLIRLPPPGKWVIAMRPFTARELANIFFRRSIGVHRVEGICVSLSKVVMPSTDPIWCVTIDQWPGSIVLSDDNLHQLQRMLVLAAEKRSDVSIESSGNAREYSIG